MSAILRTLIAASVFAVLAPLAACDTTSDAPTDAGSTDADAKGDTRITDAKSDANVECCPIDPPSCNGTRLGGSPDANGRCGGAIADAPPPNFTEFLDENGCRTYRVSSGGSSLNIDAGRYGPAPAASVE